MKILFRLMLSAGIVSCSPAQPKKSVQCEQELMKHGLCLSERKELFGELIEMQDQDIQEIQRTGQEELILEKDIENFEIMASKYNISFEQVNAIFSEGVLSGW